MNKNELSTTGTLTAIAMIRSVLAGDDDAFRALMPDTRTDALVLIAALTALVVIQLGENAERGTEFLDALAAAALNLNQQ